MTCTQERFEIDVARHVMTVVRDEGVDRHIKFRREDRDSSYWFDIVTWNNTLVIRGDHGSYVFARLSDMFEFFRGKCKDATKLYINEGYWCEKLQAVSCNGNGNGAALEFSASSFERHVKTHLDDYFEQNPISDERRASLWHDIQGEVLDYVSDGDRSGAFHRLSDFRDSDFPNLFDDCWGWRCEEYDYHFIWCLYAIAWAIRKYDAAKTAAPADTAAA